MDFFRSVFEFGVSVLTGLLMFATIFLPLAIGIKISIKNKKNKKIAITSLLVAIAIEVLFLTLILLYIKASNNGSNAIIILTTSFLMFFSLIIISPLVLPFISMYILNKKKEAGESIVLFAIVLSIVEFVLILLNVGIFSGVWISLM